MSHHRSRFTGDSRLLHRRAIRIPLPNEAAELGLHLNMATTAAAQEQKADLIEDPDVPMLDVYESQLDGIAQSYRDAVERDAGDDFEGAALAYSSGDRADGVAAMAAYLSEGIWRIQQMFTVTDMVVFPIVLRYPDCCTVNVRFARGGVNDNVVWYESPEHSAEELDEEYAEVYHCESQYSQRQAAERIRESAQVVRDQFPDPRETSFEERRLGGIVTAFGRQGSQFCSGLEAVNPSPDRFDDTISEPQIIEESPIARQTEDEWLDDDAVVL
ncbi:hypothetical protein SAMN04487950_0976 [Halogranum rubrum]|uniref:Uncharacterized protein n=1 Tax=Halogranum rubrum TaxID=553466 RepID=A0A1I4C5N2_9EURY|nr:hypothetical protein [Halogranum rubrum]SFK76444.1 hypothetical protein SAMN04487950_0976 [Halogranum rubrum]